MTGKSSFAQSLKQRRKALGLTQKELAQQAGCAEITLRKIEGGDLRTRLLRPQRPNNLPAQLTPLIGREHDVAAVRRRLLSDGARLVTLVGPPGVGKTRLALAVAEEVLEHFEHGAFFVRLGPVSDPALVPSAIAQALGIELSGPNPPELQLRAWLQEKHLLLVLDNFEQITAAAPLVDDLLRRCPWLHVLTTSRQPLRVRGERQVPVRPLALPIAQGGASRLTGDDALRYAAVAMFAERAEAVQPDFAVDDGNAAAVAELCRRLDGLPLAIELVAARVKLLPLHELLVRLHGPWLLSADGLQDVSARQKTLRGAIGWSYDLLSPTEQALLMRLAVFVGGCTLEAAEMLCEEGAPGGQRNKETEGPEKARNAAPFRVLDGIASLLDKSLLHREAGPNGETRYILFETVREFADERLAAAGAAEELRSRHLAWCLAVAQSAVPAPFAILERASWRQIDAEAYNLRAGLEWALQHNGVAAVQLVLAISRYLANRGLVREALTWIDRVFSLPEAAEATKERAALLYCRGTAEFLADEVDAAEISLAESLALSRSLDLISGRAGSLYFLGRLAAMAGDVSRAEAHLEAAAEAYLEMGDVVDWGHVISILAEIAMFRGDLQHSRALHMRAVTRDLAPEQRHLVFWSVGGLADLALVEGDYASAQRHAEECLVLCRQRNNPGETAWPLTCLGEIATRRGDFAAAHAYLDEALTLGRKADSYWRVAIVSADLGDLAVVEDRPGEALQLYRESLPILLQRGIFAHPQGSLRLACLASALDQHEVAATLLAACSAAVERGLEVLFPITQADFERVLAASQTALDADTFQDAWAIGRPLSPHAAVAMGLQAIHVSE